MGVGFYGAASFIQQLPFRLWVYILLYLNEDWLNEVSNCNAVSVSLCLLSLSHPPNSNNNNLNTRCSNLFHPRRSCHCLLFWPPRCCQILSLHTPGALISPQTRLLQYPTTKHPYLHVPATWHPLSATISAAAIQHVPLRIQVSGWPLGTATIQRVRCKPCAASCPTVASPISTTSRAYITATVDRSASTIPTPRVWLQRTHNSCSSFAT